MGYLRTAKGVSLVCRMCEPSRGPSSHVSRAKAEWLSHFSVPCLSAATAARGGTQCLFGGSWHGTTSHLHRWPGKCRRPQRALNLDANIEFILAGLERWKASDRWKRCYVANPLTILNQERWKDEPPPAPSSPSKPDETRVRESTAEEKEDARLSQEIMHQRKLPENLRKSDDELAKLAHDALCAA